MKRHKEHLDKEGLDLMRSAVDEGLRMQRLVEDLLTFSREGREVDRAQVVDTGRLVEECRQSLSASIESAGALIAHGPLPLVLGNRGQLRQLFQNLLSNALKFRAAASPRIEISVGREGAEWRFSVKDNGIGFDMKYANKIFLIFQRLHSREEYEGSGIGLALCRRIVEEHQGRIWGESEPGRGAIFHFTLPALPPGRERQ